MSPHIKFNDHGCGTMEKVPDKESQYLSYLTTAFCVTSFPLIGICLNDF